MNLLNELFEQQLKISPIGENSKRIFYLKQHALIGVSPFNSYFNEQNLTKLIHWALDTFKKVSIFIPDKISVFTLMGFGYTQKRAENKTRRQDNYLRNKVFRVLKKLHLNENEANELVINFSDLSKNINYQKLYNECLVNFENCIEFKKGCFLTSSWMLENHLKMKSLEKEKPEIAVQYFLKELPLFLNTSAILDLESSIFIYHRVPKYLETLYLSQRLISSNQGFLEVKLI